MSKRQAAMPKHPMIDVSTSISLSTDKSEPSSKQLNCAGRHFIIDFWGAQKLEDTSAIEQALREAASAAGAVLLHIHLHKFTQGGGVTGVALLAESHISVHTWPELDYAAFDVFMCGASKPEKAVSCLKRHFEPERYEVKQVLRGEKQP